MEMSLQGQVGSERTTQPMLGPGADPGVHPGAAVQIGRGALG